MTSRPRPSNWLVRLLSIKGQMSLAVKQNSFLTQDRLTSWKNFRWMTNFTEASGIANSIEEDPGRRAPALASSLALHFPGRLQCPGAHNNETLVKGPERRRQTAATFFNDPSIVGLCYILQKIIFNWWKKKQQQILHKIFILFKNMLCIHYKIFQFFFLIKKLFFFQKKKTRNFKYRNDNVFPCQQFCKNIQTQAFLIYNTRESKSERAIASK